MDQEARLIRGRRNNNRIRSGCLCACTRLERFARRITGRITGLRARLRTLTASLAILLSVLIFVLILRTRTRTGRHTATHAATTTTTGKYGTCQRGGNQKNDDLTQCFHVVLQRNVKGLPTTSYATTTATSGTRTTATSSEGAATSEAGIATRNNPPLAGFIAGAVGMAFHVHFLLLSLCWLKISFRRVLRLGEGDAAGFCKDIAWQGKIERTLRLAVGQWRRGLSPGRRGNDEQ